MCWLKMWARSSQGNASVGAFSRSAVLAWKKASSMALRRAVFIWNSLAQQLEGHDSGPIVQVNTL
jgi:hypothetical protein